MVPLVTHRSLLSCLSRRRSSLNLNSVLPHLGSLLQAYCIASCRTVSADLMLRTLTHYAASCSSSVQQQLAPAAGSVLGSVLSFEPEAFTQWQGRRWATKKQGGSTKNKKGSLPKYLGTKMSNGQLAFPGQVLVTQRGTNFHPGHNVGVGTDFTLFSKTVGQVKFRREQVVLPGRPNHSTKSRKFIDVLPLEDDWSPGYQQKVAAMVQSRNEIRRSMLGYAAQFGKKV